MADFWSQYKNDFPDLGGGFKPQSVELNTTGMTGQRTPLDGFKDQQPYLPPDPRVTTQPQPYQPFIPPAIAKDPNKPGAFIDPGTGQPYQGSPPMDMQHIMGTAGGGPDAARERLQQILSKHQGGFFGKIANAVTSPQFQQFIHDKGAQQRQGVQNVAQIAGPLVNQVGNWMHGGNLSAMGPIQQQMAANGGFYAPPAVQMGPNGPQQTPGQPQQPMNPGQQSGQVQMQAPDGTMQYVNQEHVPHYQGLGASVVNGSSYGGGQ